MPQRFAKVSATGVLLEHGFCDYGAAGLPVPDDFALRPGQWQWDGRTWVTYTRTAADKEALAVRQLDDLVLLKALALVVADLNGLTPVQMRDLIKQKYRTLT